MSVAPRDRFGKYEIIGLIGSGGMGDVYRARDPRLERDVAIKAIRSSNVDDVDARARLWREARAAASVSHPSICQIFDVGETDQDIFIVMELLNGEPLANRLKDGAIPLEQGVAVALSILGALTVLHTRGIVHRDLKPSNVFMTDGGVKLLDFGLARSRQAVGSDMTVTRAGTVVGTPRYMAPEQWGESKADSRSDLFAAGALLFEMLSGAPAFPGSDLMQVYHAIMSGHPPALGGSTAVAAIDAVIHRALEKRPEDRYQSADAMAQALRAAVTLASTTSTQTPVRTTRRLIAPRFSLVQSARRHCQLADRHPIARRPLDARRREIHRKPHGRSQSDRHRSRRRRRADRHAAARRRPGACQCAARRSSIRNDDLVEDRANDDARLVRGAGSARARDRRVAGDSAVVR
jgi:serine/threonine protein kinase